MNKIEVYADPHRRYTVRDRVAWAYFMHPYKGPRELAKHLDMHVTDVVDFLRESGLPIAWRPERASK